MLGRYKVRILQLTRSLRTLESDPEKIDSLWALQSALLRLIMTTETNIERVRQAKRQAKVQLRNGRLPKEDASALRSLVRRYETRIADYQRLKFIWKCFGDGIAFIYLDKYALKHMYYDTQNCVPKQDAGAVSGKAGLKQERRIVRALSKNRVPALLCDITNTLRHGDICILVGPDPIPIEVKSSRHANPRVERQRERLDKLTSFFKNDEARNFRGFPHISRLEFGQPEITHFDALTSCIANADGNSIGRTSPEPGLQYLCIRSAGGLNDLPPGTINRDSIMCLVNEAKSDQRWAPYYPFTLSIRNPEYLYAFIRGDITLAVIVDVAELRRQFLAGGIEISIPLEGDWAMWLRHLPEEAVSAVSRQLFGRLFHEFQSLSWFVAVNSDFHRRIEEGLGAQTLIAGSGQEQLTSGWIGEIPGGLKHPFGEDEDS